MGDIDMLDDSIKKDALFVTPIGICINFYENKNNFTFVTVNQKRVKIYNNNKLAVMDAAAAAGYPNDRLFARRGKDITFTINGKQRIVRGQKGEPAQIRLNHNLVSMATQINANDKIEIVESTMGEPAYIEIGQLPEFQSQIHFRVNNKTISCPKIIQVNEEYKTEFYSIQDGDRVLILDFYTVEQLRQFLDLKKEVTVYVNHEKAEMRERIYDNYMVDWEEQDSIETVKKEAEPAEKQIEAKERSPKTETEKEEQNDYSEKAMVNVVPDGLSKVAGEIIVTVNQQPVVLKNKSQYIFVDILDFYPFDMSVMGGSELVIQKNGQKAEFTTPVAEGDNLDIFWR